MLCKRPIRTILIGIFIFYAFFYTLNLSICVEERRLVNREEIKTILFDQLTRMAERQGIKLQTDTIEINKLERSPTLVNHMPWLFGVQFEQSGLIGQAFGYRDSCGGHIEMKSLWLPTQN